MGEARGGPGDRRLSGLKAQLESGMKQARTLAASVSRRRTKSWDGKEGSSEGRGTPSEPSTPGAGRFANTVVSPRTLAAREAEKEAALAALDSDYYDPDYDPVLAELRQLPPQFGPDTLDAVVEERAAVLEAVTEKLSAHVLENYDKFVAGVNEVVCVEQDLQVAHAICRQSRTQLGGALAEVRADMSIARRQRAKQGLSDMAELLGDLKAAVARTDELRDAQEAGDFAAAFWLAAQCSRALEALAPLRVTRDLSQGVQQQYEAALQRLEATLLAACADFRAELYTKVLEGYHYLGNVGSLGEEVMNGFAAAVNSAALRVVRTMALARARSGVEEKARGATILQEAVKLLPPDLFRQCLTQVLMVIFDVLVSHFRMSRWHEERIAQHLAQLAALQEARRELEERRAAAGGLAAQSSPSRREGNAANPPTENGAQSAVTQTLSSISFDSSGPKDSPRHQRSALAKAAGETANIVNPLADPLGAEGHEHANGRGVLDQQAHEGLGKDGGNAAREATANGGPALPALAPEDGADSPEQPREEGGLDAEMAALEEKGREEASWGEALIRVSEGLSSGRRWLWDEAARKVGVLLASPAALEGEHFLQVLEWTQQMLHVGEAFSGSESSTLRDTISRQSARFFHAYHASNLQVLHTMLERERWVRLPVVPGGLPNLVEALEGARESPATRFDTNSFAEWVAHGNPWRKQEPGEVEEAVVAVESSSEDEADEVYGDSIDEDSQRVKRSLTSSSSGRGQDEIPTMTNASWRLIKWAREYAGLMRVLRSDCGTVYSGLCELFEMYFLHAYYVFSDVPIPEMVAQKQVKAQGGGDAVPSRLRSAIIRILSRSLTKYRKLYLPPPPPPGTSPAPSNGQSGGPGGLQSSSSSKDFGTPFSGRGQGASPGQGGPASPAVGPTPLCNAGNMFGLMERKVAADSLAAVAGQLTAAQLALSEKLLGRSDVPDHHALDTFFQTVKAVTDLREVMFRGAARANLALTWLPERLVEQNWNLEEPPTKAGRWVATVLHTAKQLRYKLDTAEGLSTADKDLLWRHTAQYVGELVLEGFARAGARTRCTVMGRSAMSLDLQAVQRGLLQLAGDGPGAAGIADTLRIVDNYIKAYYISWGDELQRWALTHPEYTKNQLICLVACVADAQGLKKKDRNAFIAQLEIDLAEVRN